MLGHGCRAKPARGLLASAPERDGLECAGKQNAFHRFTGSFWKRKIKKRLICCRTQEVSVLVAKKKGVKQGEQMRWLV